MLDARGFAGLYQLYSGFIYTTPLVWLGCVVALFRTRDRQLILICVHAVLALPLSAAQFRFHYYGSLAMYLPLFFVADKLSINQGRKVWLLCAAAICIAAYLPVKNQLFVRVDLGNDAYYRMSRVVKPAFNLRFKDLESCWRAA